MSTHNRIIGLVLAELDVVVAGLALSYVAIQTLRNFNSTSSSLHKVRQAKSVHISDLRSLVSSSGNDSDEKLVIIRGYTERKSVVDGNWWRKSSRPSVLLASDNGSKKKACVVLQNTKTCIYNDVWLRGTILGKSFTSTKTLPFILIGSGPWPRSYVVINMDGSTHQLPLETVYHQLHPFDDSPPLNTYETDSFKAIVSHGPPDSLLVEKKILELGKEISAVGKISTSQDGYPQIKGCQDLPYFLSDMTKDQMVEDLAYKAKVLFWTGITLGLLSLGVLGYAFTRYWQRSKKWRQQTQVHNDDDVYVDEGPEGVPVGQLCVSCLMRKRRSAFVPCGHLVCHKCALSVQRNSAPQCPECGQAIETSVIIYVP